MEGWAIVSLGSCARCLLGSRTGRQGRLSVSYIGDDQGLSLGVAIIGRETNLNRYGVGEPPMMHVPVYLRI